MELRNLSSAGDCISEITQQRGMVVATRNFERTENGYCKEPQPIFQIGLKMHV